MVDESGLDMDFTSGMAAFEAKEFSRAKQFLSPFAEQGNAEAQHRMAIMYQNGLGLVKDEAKAAEWFEKAANQGMAGAAMTLGMMYEQGQGVAQDADKAQEWYKKSETMQQ